LSKTVFEDLRACGKIKVIEKLKFRRKKEMYIANKYWNNYIGDTDDSLTLVEYLAEKQKEEISLYEIFSDFGLNKLNNNFRKPDVPLVFTDSKGCEITIYYAIDLITDIAALLLECKINGSINLYELFDNLEEIITPNIHIAATPEEHKMINNVLMDFVTSPLDYDLSEMVSEEEMLEMTAICEELRTELYG